MRNNNTRFARSMNEAFPQTPEAAEWLEAPQPTGLRVSWMLGLMVAFSVIVMIVGALCQTQ